MACGHCCGRYGPRGTDMPMEVFRQSLEFAADYGDECISIGGGEPTLHPHFWDMLGLAIVHFNDVWMATNGSQTDIALRLAQLARKNVISVELSRDEWHAEIDARVVREFEEMQNERDRCWGGYRWGGYREGDQPPSGGIRETFNPIRAGRAMDLENAVAGCSCPGIIIRPLGQIIPCGCPTAPVAGNVFDGIYPTFSDPHNQLWSGDCYHDWDSTEERA